MKENLQLQKNAKMHGITLIALVVTIVVLLILAGITISLVFSENGIIIIIYSLLFNAYSVFP